MADARDAAPAPAPGSFLGNVNVVIVTYALDGLLALVTGALIARALGPDGRGAYGLFVVSAALGQLVLGFGIGNAAIYYLNKRDIGLRAIISAMHVVVLGSVVVTAAAVAVLVPLDVSISVGGETFRIAGDDVFGPVAPWLLVAAVPVLLYMNLLRLALQALSRFIDLGIATVGQQAVMLSLVAFAYAAGDPTASQVVVFLVIASAAAAAYALLRVGLANVDVGQIVRPRWATLRRLARFGVQGEAGNVLQLMNYRLDQYIVRAFVSLAGVGIYAVGVSMTEAIFILANAVALVLMPRLTAATEEEVAWMTPVATRNTVLIAAGGALALGVAAPLLIPGVFGDRYRDSVEALWWLLPGTVALAGSKVLTSYIFSRGRPLVNTGITAVSLVVTLVADFALIPRFGVNGAAAASSLAYGAHLGAALFAYARISGRSPVEALLPRPRDAQLYTDAIHGVMAKIARRPQLEAGG